MTYWLTRPTPFDDLTRAITVRGVEKYWWSYGCTQAHREVLNFREEIRLKRAERRHVYIDFEQA